MIIIFRCPWDPLTHCVLDEYWQMKYREIIWVNNGKAGDLRRHRAHCDVNVMHEFHVEMIYYEWPCHKSSTLSPFIHILNANDIYLIYKQRVLMHGHQGWNVRHGLCHIYMIYVNIWVVYSFCLFCCLFIIVTTQFVALYKPCKPKPKPSTYDPPDNHPLAEIQRPILRPEPKQQKCHQHANTDHFGK